MIRFSARSAGRLALALVVTVVVIAALLPLTQTAFAAGACSVTVTAVFNNNVPEERTARIRIIDTADNGRIIANVEAVLQPNDTRTLTLTSDVNEDSMILINRAGMRLVSYDTAFTGDPEVCDAVQIFIGDGRINAGLNQQAAPLAGYCTRRGGIDVYDIDNQGRGQLAFRVTAAQIKAAQDLAVTSGQNQLIAQGLNNALYALTTRELQFQGIFDYNPADVGKVYNFIMPGDTCAVS